MGEEIKVIKNEKDTLEIEIVEGDEGLGEVLVKHLNDEKGVEFAAYRKEHPFDKGIKLIIKAKKSPKKMLLSAIKKTKKEIEELDKLIQKV